MIRPVFADEGFFRRGTPERGPCGGSRGLPGPGRCNFFIVPHDVVAGCRLGVLRWGRGSIPEAVRRLMRHTFDGMGLAALWCGYFAVNW